MSLCVDFLLFFFCFDTFIKLNSSLTYSYTGPCFVAFTMIFLCTLLLISVHTFFFSRYFLFQSEKINDVIFYCLTKKKRQRECIYLSAWKSFCRCTFSSRNFALFFTSAGHLMVSIHLVHVHFRIRFVPSRCSVDKWIIFGMRCAFFLLVSSLVKFPFENLYLKVYRFGERDDNANDGGSSEYSIKLTWNTSSFRLEYTKKPNNVCFDILQKKNNNIKYVFFPTLVGALSINLHSILLLRFHLKLVLGVKWQQRRN